MHGRHRGACGRAGNTRAQRHARTASRRAHGRAGGRAGGRQEQLPASKVVKAFTHIQAPRIIAWGRPASSPDRLALSASSDFPEAVEIARRLYDQFGFDTVDNSPLSESWRTRPGQPAWKQERQTQSELAANIAKARRP